MYLLGQYYPRYVCKSMGPVLSNTDIIDIQGRVWNINNAKISLDSRDHPSLDGGHSLYVGNLALTRDGRIYDLSERIILDIPYRIKGFIDNGFLLFLTVDGVLMMGTDDRLMTRRYTKIRRGVSHLLGYVYDGYDERILIVDSNGLWKEIDMDGEDKYIHQEIPGDIIKVKEEHVITSEGLVQYDFGYGGSFWAINFTRAVDNIRDVASIQREDHERSRVIILDDQGKLYLYWNYGGEEKLIECTNKMIIEFNEQRQWTRLVADLFEDGSAGLVNEIGEIYVLNIQFLASSTNLPTEIFAIPPTRTKSARSVQ